MVKSCVELISSFLVNNEYITIDKYEWCCYVLEKRLVKLISFLAIFVIGIKMNMLLDTIIFITSFCFLRKYANGYHAKTFETCLVYSLMIVILAIKYITPVLLIYPQISMIIFLFLMLSYLSHIRFIDKKVYENKLFIRNVLITSILVIICKIINRKQIACTLLSSMLFTLITIKIKYKCGDKNEY